MSTHQIGSNYSFGCLIVLTLQELSIVRIIQVDDDYEVRGVTVTFLWWLLLVLSIGAAVVLELTNSKQLKV